jgi:hypothetical protein
MKLAAILSSTRNERHGVLREPQLMGSLARLDQLAHDALKIDIWHCEVGRRYCEHQGRSLSFGIPAGIVAAADEVRSEISSMSPFFGRRRVSPTHRVRRWLVFISVNIFKDGYPVH